MIVTNHTYDVIGSYVPTKEMGGGTGLKYAASTIIYLSKSKERDSKKEVVGNIIKCEAKKSRLTVEGSKVATRLFFDERGLDKYYAYWNWVNSTESSNGSVIGFVLGNLPFILLLYLLIPKNTSPPK